MKAKRANEMLQDGYLVAVLGFSLPIFNIDLKTVINVLAVILIADIFLTGIFLKLFRKFSGLLVHRKTLERFYFIAEAQISDHTEVVIFDTGNQAWNKRALLVENTLCAYIAYARKYGWLDEEILPLRISWANFHQLFDGMAWDNSCILVGVHMMKSSDKGLEDLLAHEFAHLLSLTGGHKDAWFWYYQALSVVHENKSIDETGAVVK